MTVEVLVAAMYQEDHSLLEKMNIQTDVIVGNQCDHDSVEHFTFRGHRAMYLNFAERGVGLNRNNALMRASGDICLFADEDCVYVDGYEQIILSAYARHPNADVIIFNMRESRNGGTMEDRVFKERRVGKKGVSSYGTVLVSAKTERLKWVNVVFHRSFGGGTAYSCGEDTIFLQDCCRNGLRIYTCPDTIGEVHNEDSTWFQGYNDKYFFDKGVLFKYLYPRLAWAISIYHGVKHRKLYAEYGMKKAITMMEKGCREYPC